MTLLNDHSDRSLLLVGSGKLGLFLFRSFIHPLRIGWFFVSCFTGLFSDNYCLHAHVLGYCAALYDHCCNGGRLYLSSDTLMLLMPEDGVVRIWDHYDESDKVHSSRETSGFLILSCRRDFFSFSSYLWHSIKILQKVRKVHIRHNVFRVHVALPHRLH